MGSVASVISVPATRARTAPRGIETRIPTWKRRTRAIPRCLRTGGLPHAPLEAEPHGEHGETGGDEDDRLEEEARVVLEEARRDEDAGDHDAQPERSPLEAPDGGGDEQDREGGEDRVRRGRHAEAGFGHRHGEEEEDRAADGEERAPGVAPGQVPPPERGRGDRDGPEERRGGDPGPAPGSARDLVESGPLGEPSEGGRVDGRDPGGEGETGGRGGEGE